jgi:hypothetical protein
MLVDVAAVLIGLLDRWTRDQTAFGPTVPFPQRVVVTNGFLQELCVYMQVQQLLIDIVLLLSARWAERYPLSQVGTSSAV